MGWSRNSSPLVPKTLDCEPVRAQELKKRGGRLKI